MMANDADQEMKMAQAQTLQQAIHLKFGTQNASEQTQSANTIRPKFIIPKLLSASGKPFEERKLNIPLLDRLRSQNNSLEINYGLAKNVSALKISESNKEDGIQDKGLKLTSIREQDTAPIDLTSALIAVPKDAPPREAASKQRHKQIIVEHFDIPFISCENKSLSTSMLFGKRRRGNSDVTEATPIAQIKEKYSEIGSMLDASVGYPNPRKPQLKYAATATELLNLKLYYREDYGANIKRFRFDTPSPDELVKLSLLKSFRISRT